MQSNLQLNASVQSTTGEHGLLSKVILVEHDAQTLMALKPFFEECKLIGYRASSESALSILGANIDLGGIFLSEVDSHGQDCFDLVRALDKARPDLPIFMRLAPGHTVQGIPDDVTKALAGKVASGVYAGQRFRHVVRHFLPRMPRRQPHEYRQVGTRLVKRAHQIETVLAIAVDFG